MDEPVSRLMCKEGARLRRELDIALQCLEKSQIDQSPTASNFLSPEDVEDAVKHACYDALLAAFALNEHIALHGCRELPQS